jgi:glycylpeptide N-tetradecanoyltransferase
VGSDSPRLLQRLAHRYISLPVSHSPGVRVIKSKKLVGFITGIPVHVHANELKFKAAEINFLCVHKKLRSNRLAPVLIKEVTRRVHLKNIWQAVYTAGTLIPTPITQARYFHRSLNPKKLIDVSKMRRE